MCGRVIGGDGARGKGWLRVWGHHLCLSGTIFQFFCFFFFFFFFGYGTGFPVPATTPNIKISLVKFCYSVGFPFQNSSKNLDPSYNLDFWDCSERKHLRPITEKI